MTAALRPALAGWYPAPSGEPIPWYFDGEAWTHPAERFDTYIAALFPDERLARLTQHLTLTRSKAIRRKLFYAQIRQLFNAIRPKVYRSTSAASLPSRGRA